MWHQFYITFSEIDCNYLNSDTKSVLGTIKQIFQTSKNFKHVPKIKTWFVSIYLMDLVSFRFTHGVLRSRATGENNLKFNK